MSPLQSQARSHKGDLDTSNWSRENMAWAAGFFEGEGTINLKPDGYCVEIAAYQKEPEVLHKLQEIIGGGTIYNDKNGSCWKVVRKNEVYAVLVAMYPWLSTRRKSKVKEVITKLFPAWTT